MAREHLLARGRPNAAPSRTMATAALLGFALLAPVACGSGSDEGGDAAATEPSDPSRGSEAPPRDARPADREPSAADDAPAEPAAPSPADAPDEAPAAPGAGADSSSRLPPAPAATFASCTRRDGRYGSNCDYLYVTMTQTSPERCVQLTIDNCGDG